MTMRIAVASGKGGTGKTTVATNLAYVASRDGRCVAYLDCDVEEPNGHIFLKPEITKRAPIGTLIPKVDEDACYHCGKCGEICQYSAIVCVGERVLVYPELCHACAGCWLVCPVGAIAPASREIGTLAYGQADSICCVQGLLNIGEAMSPPAIKAVKAATPDAELVITDAPPGTSCPVIESIRDSHYVILVTEPTPFGLHDLGLAVEMVRALRRPFGVVINRADVGNDEVHRYCVENRIVVLAQIPEDRCVAEAYACGRIASEAIPGYASLFMDLLRDVVHNATAGSGGPADARAGRH